MLHILGHKHQPNFFFEKQKSGWSSVFKKMYAKLSTPGQVIPHVTPLEFLRELDNIITFAGKVEICKMLAAREKSGLAIFSEPVKNEFTFKYVHELAGVEMYERADFHSYVEIINQHNRLQKLELFEKYPEIKRQLTNTVRNPKKQFISYSSPPDVDEFYAKLGYYHLCELQGYDDFDESDEFGGLPFKLYLDYVERLCGVALKHRDYCFALSTYINPEINLNNIFSYTWSTERTIENYSHAFDVDTDQVRQIHSCLTMDHENFRYHLAEEGNLPGPYIKISETQVIRTLSGSLFNCVDFLKKELRRRFEKDFFKITGGREARFKRQLYSLFPESILKVDHDVDIGTTDIDAVMFDTEKKTLALFQLKWYGTFDRSLRERNSRKSNIYNNSVVWLNKVHDWLKDKSQKTILENVGVRNEESISETFVFILARHHVHFTGAVLDDRAAWASWYHLVIHIKKDQSIIHADPIRELFNRIKANEPALRHREQPLPQVEDIDFQFEKFKLFYKT